jgi:hypothetical protein
MIVSEDLVEGTALLPVGSRLIISSKYVGRSLDVEITGWRQGLMELWRQTGHLIRR